MLFFIAYFLRWEWRSHSGRSLPLFYFFTLLT
jgi:hypothetical protein